MSEIKHIIRRMQSRLHNINLTWNRALRHSRTAITAISGLLEVLSVVAAIGCLLCATLYIGFEREANELRTLLVYFRTFQCIFLAKVLFNLIFNLKNTIENTRVIKWIVDITLLSTLLPALYPRPAHPWIPWLEDVLYSNKFLLGILVAFAIVEISYFVIRIMGKRTNPSLILSCSFLFFIFLGSFLLMMPRCTYHGIGYIDSLFVSTSAVCITGLTTIDVASTFTPLGLLILGLLIQIGGLGVMTFTSFFALFFSGNTSVYSQLMVKDMIYSKTINALLPTLLYILGFTVIVELIGAFFIWLSIHDVLIMSTEDQIIFSIFHAVSAFCNAGFSNLPGGMANPGLMNSNQMIYIVIGIIVMAGGIGFPILVNFKEAFIEYFRRLWRRINHRTKIGRSVHIWNVNTKIALYTTLIIFAVSTVVFFILERNNTLAGMSLYDSIVQSFFNSTTPRSSGFVSVNPANFLNVTLVIVLFLMWIGGASQSTAGGVKVNTFALILLNLKSIILGKDHVTVYDRTIAVGSIRRANAVVAISIVSYTIYSVILLLLEPQLPAKSVLFETSSALFTVGSSLGITSELGMSSKIVLCTAMFLGRVGIISLLIGVTGNRHDYPVKYPTENIIIN